MEPSNAEQINYNSFNNNFINRLFYTLINNIIR
jgi:hypothetical protein